MTLDHPSLLSHGCSQHNSFTTPCRASTSIGLLSLYCQCHWPNCQFFRGLICPSVSTTQDSLFPCLFCTQVEWLSCWRKSPQARRTGVGMILCQLGPPQASSSTQQQSHTPMTDCFPAPGHCLPPLVPRPAARFFLLREDRSYKPKLPNIVPSQPSHLTMNSFHSHQL